MLNISVKNPGTLKEQLEEGEWRKTKSLKIEGPLNELDFNWLDELQSINKGLYAINLFDTQRAGDIKRPFIIERGISNLNIPDGIKEIKKKDLFCLSINTINISKSVFKIEKGAFSNCPELKIINVSEQNLKYKSINGLLYTKDGLELLFCPPKREGSIFIQNETRKIADRAFQGCDKLCAVIIPSSIDPKDTGTLVQDFTNKKVEIRWSVDQNKYNLGDTQYSEGGKILVRHSPDFEDYQEGQPNYDLLKKSEYEFNVPNGVEEIYPKAFYNCFQLKSIKLPHSLTVIQSEAFSNCSHIEAIELPDKLKFIGENSFNGCRNLGKICCWSNIPPKCEGAIIEQTNDKLLYIPKGSLEKYRKAKGWKHFKNIREVDNLTIADIRMNNGEKNRILYSPTIIKSELKDYVKDIWHNIAKISLTGRITETDINQLKRMCREGQLSDIDLANSQISSLTNKAFADIENLITIELPNTIEYIPDGLLIGCKKLRRIGIGTSTKKIGDFAFAECTNLKSCVFNGEINELGRGVCWNCQSLETIILGDNINRIGGDCFRGCENLSKIECHNPNPPTTEDDSFPQSSFSNAELFYPLNGSNAYLKEYKWNKFEKKTAENILF